MMCIVRIIANLFLLGTCLAEIPPPQINIRFSNDLSGKLGGFEPTIKWESSKEVGPYDIEGGVEVAVDDLQALPFTVWGKIKRTISDFDVAIRGKVASQNPEEVAVQIRAEGPTTSVQVDGIAGSEVSVGKVQVKKALEQFGGSWLVHPTYDVESKEGDVSVAYSLENTSIKVAATKDVQKVTVARVVGEKNIVTPSFTNTGDFSLDVYRELGEDLGTVTGTLKPQDSIHVKWEKGPSQVDVHAPMGDGLLDFDGVNVSYKRNVEF